MTRPSRVCVRCGRPETEVWIGRRGQCTDCGRRAWLDAVRQMRDRTGPYYDRWAAAGGAKGRPPKRGGPPDADATPDG